MHTHTDKMSFLLHWGMYIPALYYKNIESITISLAENYFML